MASTSVVFDILARDRASDKFDNLGRSVGRTEGRMSKFGAVAKGAAKTGVLALAVGAVFAGKALVDMTKAAIEDEAAAKNLATALKNNADATDAQVASTEDWISAQGKALGVTDDELRPALARLVTATKDVGEAQKLASLSMDVAAGSGKSLESVSTAMMKAANGQVSALSRLGINTKKANGETISFEEAQRRMAATFKGQAEKNANTLSGKMQRLKVVLSEAGEEIGAKLIPVVTRMADWFLNKGLPAIEAFGDYLNQKLPPIFAMIKGVIDKFSGDGSGKLGKFMSDVKGIFTDGVAIVTRLWELFGDNIVQFLRSTFENVKMILSGAFDIIKGIFKTVSALLRGDWKEAWNGIKMILRGAVTVVVGLVRQTFNLLRFAFKNAGTILKNVWSAMWDGIKTLAARGKDWLVAKIRAIPGAIKSLAGNYRDAGAWILGKFVEIVKAKAADGGEFIMTKIRAIPGLVRGLGGKFLEAGRSIVASLFQGIRNAAGGAGGLLGDVAGSFASTFKGVINGLISNLNSAIPNEIEINNAPNINLPDNPIPYLARGTNNWRGGYAIVGEEGPELVNLPRGSRVTPHKQSMGELRAIGQGRGGVTVNINGPVYGDPRAFAREVQKSLLTLKRDQGTALGLA